MMPMIARTTVGPFDKRQKRQARHQLPSTRLGMGSVPYNGGTTFRIWAPNADQVYVTGSFNNWAITSTSLAYESDGMWSADIPNAKSGDEYKFVIRNGTQALLRADPYLRDVLASRKNIIVFQPCRNQSGSLQQPTSNHPPSVDNELTTYELHVGMFGHEDDDQSDESDAEFNNLPFLRAVGINAIELILVVALEGDCSSGYEPAQPFVINHNDGVPIRLRKLIKAAQEHGIIIIVDAVCNHLGSWGLDLWQFEGWNENGLRGIYL